MPLLDRLLSWLAPPKRCAYCQQTLADDEGETCSTLCAKKLKRQREAQRRAL